MSNTLVPLVEGSVDELRPLLTTVLLTTVLDFRFPGVSVTALLLSLTPRCMSTSSLNPIHVPFWYPGKETKNR